MKVNTYYNPCESMQQANTNCLRAQPEEDLDTEQASSLGV
jgi:hypothetical protein